MDFSYNMGIWALLFKVILISCVSNSISKTFHHLVWAIGWVIDYWIADKFLKIIALLLILYMKFIGLIKVLILAEAGKLNLNKVRIEVMKLAFLDCALSLHWLCLIKYSKFYFS